MPSSPTDAPMLPPAPSSMYTLPATGVTLISTFERSRCCATAARWPPAPPPATTSAAIQPAAPAADSVARAPFSPLPICPSSVIRETDRAILAASGRRRPRRLLRWRRLPITGAQPAMMTGMATPPLPDGVPAAPAAAPVTGAAPAARAAPAAGPGAHLRSPDSGRRVAPPPFARAAALAAELAASGAGEGRFDAGRRALY